MKLSKIDITHFRCFESLSIALQPDVNVIVGINGAGKTSILDAIAIALYELVAALSDDNKRHRTMQGASLKASDIYLDPNASSAIEGRKAFVQVRATANDFYPAGDFPRPTLDGQSAALEWNQYISYQAPARFTYAARTSDRLSDLYGYIQSLWQEIRTSPKALIPLPVVAYYRATRRIGAMPELGDIFKLDLSQDKAYANALDAASNFTAMCQWFYLLENAELRAKTQFHDLNAVRMALRHAIEGVERIYFDGSPPKLLVDVRERDGSLRSLELEQLSDGYRNLIALMLDFARRLAQTNPNFNNPLEAPGILLIDEMELHLHPCWQQTVIPSLRQAFPNTQIIVTTHSPAVLTTVRREHIHLLGANHQFEHIPDDVGTYGAESSHVLAEVLGADSRPRCIDSVEKLNQYLGLIESRQHDTPTARSLRTELESAMGKSDPGLRRADLLIRHITVLDGIDQNHVVRSTPTPHNDEAAMSCN